MKEQVGYVKPRCEALEREMYESRQELNSLIRPKTEIEIQADTEKDRGWIRSLNSKLYDHKINQMIQDSSNGAEVL
jgi:hypothetical protein